MKRRIRVVERKLGRERAYGQAWKGEGWIEIDPRQKSKTYLNTLIHEAMHLLEPDWSESRVTRTANKLAALIWEKNYRRIQR